jgi:hypothetical protein
VVRAVPPRTWLAFATRPGRVFVLSHKEKLGQTRDKVRAAANQLKPLAGSQWPLVVVVADRGDLAMSSTVSS